MDLIVKQSELSVTKFDIKEGEIVAYVTTFGNEDVVGDVMAPNALDKWVKEFNDGEDNMLPMLWSHKSDSPIGHWDKFEIDNTGVKGYGTLYTETTQGDDVRKLMSRGLVNSVSVGFTASDWEDKKPRGRYFKEINLKEVSIVLNPANPQAKVVSVKEEDGVNVRALEKLLREAGLSRKESKSLIAGGINEMKVVDVLEQQKLALVNSLQKTTRGSSE